MNIIARVFAILLAAVIATAAQARDVTRVVGEVESITTRYENLTPQKLLSPLEVDYTLVKLTDGKKYQLSQSLEGIASSTIVELDIASTKTASGYPLVMSGRTLSLVTTMNGKKTILPLEVPREFDEQSN